MRVESSGKPDAWKLARPVWGWGRGEIPRPTPQELEEWLRQHNVPFRRRSEGKYEYNAETVEFRPDLKGKRNRDVYALTTPEGHPVVLAAEIKKVANRMAKVAADRKRSARQRLQAWGKLLAKLVHILPPKLPPLPPFEIVDG